MAKIISYNIIKQGVGLPKARRIFFTKENYPQRVDTDYIIEKIENIERRRSYNKQTYEK